MTSALARSSPSTTARGDARRDQIVTAAIGRLAAVGFEGFRVRDVAVDAGVHHATLHHHFPTKEDLIQAVVDQILLRFHSQQIACRTFKSPLAALACHFDSVIEQMAREPETFVILNEVFVRAHRDPKVSALLEPTQAEWRSHLRALFGDALDPLVLDQITDLTLTALRGLSLQLGARGAFVDAAAFERLGTAQAKATVKMVLDCVSPLLAGS